jgi:tRNA threonylcarbamoyladenosine biosynthesis protein TsaE
MQYIFKTEKETFAFAKKFAAKLKPGSVVALLGDLGAGKTVFAQGLARGLDVRKNINSPTFVIMKVYPFVLQNEKLNFVHIDAYRLREAGELTAIGVNDYLGKNDSIVVIEWAERVKKILPPKTVIIRIKDDIRGRRISINGL